MRPMPYFFISSAAYFIMSMVPRQLTPTTLSNSSASSSSSGTGQAIPATLARPTIGGISLAISAKAAATAFWSEMSSTSARTLSSGWASSSSASKSLTAGLRSTATMFHPSEAKRRATARAMPRGAPQPETTAVRASGKTGLV